MLTIYIQEIEGGEILQIPMTPDKIQVSAATRFLSYDIMNVGEHWVPLGEELTGFKWSGILPGENRKDAPYVSAWKNPGAIQGKFSVWRNQGKKLKLMIPETPVNHNVYLASYNCEYSGGMGDIQYDIEFITAKEVIVGAEGETTEQSGAALTTSSTSTTATPAAARTYTVKSGDSLWKIAQNVLGDGFRWQEIYSLNKSIIGGNPDLIYAGQVYNMPA